MNVAVEAAAEVEPEVLLLLLVVGEEEAVVDVPVVYQRETAMPLVQPPERAPPCLFVAAAEVVATVLPGALVS